MRLGRRASLFVTFALLTSAATAQVPADRWVLWSPYFDNPGRNEYYVFSLHDSPEACDAALQRFVDAAPFRYDTPRRSAEEWFPPLPMCLPDNFDFDRRSGLFVPRVDPRGPKGK
jgi:hypothetical protein